MSNKYHSFIVFAKELSLGGGIKIPDVVCGVSEIPLDNAFQQIENWAERAIMNPNNLEMKQLRQKVAI